MKTCTGLVIVLILCGMSTAAAQKQSGSKGKNKKADKAIVVSSREKPHASEVSELSSSSSSKGWERKEFVSIPGKGYASITWNKEGSAFLTSGLKVGYLFKEEGGKFIKKFELPHEGSVTGIIFSPAEKYIITSSYDQSVRVWDSNTGSSVRVDRMAFPVSSVSIREGSQWVIVGAGSGVNGAPIINSLFYSPIVNDVPLSSYGSIPTPADQKYRIDMDPSDPSCLILTSRESITKWKLGTDQRVLATFPNPNPMQKIDALLSHGAGTHRVVTYYPSKVKNEKVLYYSLPDRKGEVALAVPKDIKIKDERTYTDGNEVSPRGDIVVASYCYMEKSVPTRRGEKVKMERRHDLLIWKDPRKMPKTLVKGSRAKPQCKFLDNETLFVATNEGKVTIWDLRGLKPTTTLEFKDGEERLGTFEFAGNRIAITVPEGVVILEKK